MIFDLSSIIDPEILNIMEKYKTELGIKRISLFIKLVLIFHHLPQAY